MTAWPHGDPRTVAHAILTDKRYQLKPDPPEPKNLLEQFFDWLGHLWHQITRPLGHLLGNDLITTIVGFGVLALALVFLTIVIVRFARPLMLRRSSRANLAAEALADGGDAKLLLSRALAALAAQRYREAAALLWASALRALDERGRVRYDAARTPGEWRREVRDPNFDRLARDAVVALFDERELDATFVARMRASYDAVLAE
jgi:hypothetical protein